MVYDGAVTERVKLPTVTIRGQDRQEYTHECALNCIVVMADGSQGIITDLKPTDNVHIEGSPATSIKVQPSGSPKK